MNTFKNFKLPLIFISFLLIMSCSKSEIEDQLSDNLLVDTQWTYRDRDIYGGVYQYEILEFNSNNDFTISESDLNKIRTNYLAKGKYIVNGNKILCKYSTDEKDRVFILNDYNNTIYPESLPKKIYVKQ